MRTRQAGPTQPQSQRIGQFEHKSPQFAAIMAWSDRCTDLASGAPGKRDINGYLTLMLNWPEANKLAHHPATLPSI